MSKGLKVDLTLLKRLVSELEASLASADVVKEAALNSNDYVVEVSKAAGLASGLVVEATMLIGDIQYLIKSAGSPSKDDSMKDLMSLFKGTGGGLGGTN